jgi:methyl-accepting chemotaxis protein
MKNWTIGKRIIFGFATVIGLVVILAVTSVLSLRSIRKNLALVTEDSLPGITLMGEIGAAVAENQAAVLRYMLAPKPEERKALDDAMERHAQTDLKAMADYEKTIHLEEDRQNFKKLQEEREHYIKARGPLLELCQSGKTQEARDYDESTFSPAYRDYDGALAVLTKWNADYGHTGAAQIKHTVSRANLMVMVLSVLAGVIGTTFAFFIVIGVSRVLNRVSNSLGEGTEQVVSAASQVSASSQSLAEGASEQAASLEETSSSLEEMSSMTKRNAENSQKTNDLARQTRAAADKGVADMQSMTSAMAEIKKSSDDISKIIKTIDEIAFQTNILALNAAVEAARAGEAGMGFAVVADEVRNLAQRSAQAAKETAVKIEGAISKTTQGVELSGKVSETLNEIVTKARKMDELAAEVANASNEQAQGVAQVNTAVGQMDKVTQGNAASAEECAAAAEELNSQAYSMKESVGELLRLVGGASTNHAGKHAVGHATHAAHAAPVVISKAAEDLQET